MAPFFILNGQKLILYQALFFSMNKYIFLYYEAFIINNNLIFKCCSFHDILFIYFSRAASLSLGYANPFKTLVIYLQLFENNYIIACY